MKSGNISLNFDLPDSSYEERFLSKRETLANAINQLESTTGVYRDKIDLLDQKVESRLLGGDFSCVEPKLAEFLKEAYAVVRPNNYNELLKLIELAHGTRTWCYNAEILIADGVCSLSDIPSTCEELYVMIRDSMKEHGVSDSGFARDVANKAHKGYYFEHGMDGYTIDTLRTLGFDDWFASYLLGVRYMSSKTHSLIVLKYIILLTWYQTYYPKQYADSMSDAVAIDKLFQLNT